MTFSQTHDVETTDILNHAPAAETESKSTFLQDVIAGLSGTPKTLPCKYFYDHRGSQLFDAICATPEYYPTRTEIGLLQKHGRALAACVGARAHLIELGSGSSAKIRTMLDALPTLASYIPVDISGLYLMKTAVSLARDYPRLDVLPVCSDFTTPFPLPRAAMKGRRVGFFPGSTIGNFTPPEARRLLRHLAAMLGAGSGLIVGVDLKKNTAILNAAYNDAAGVTAAFNLNILERINRELRGAFDLSAFAHHAFYNENAGRVEMHLRSRKTQTVYLGGRRFSFADGETIHTENSHKYNVAEFQALSLSAGFQPHAVWTDEHQLFSIHYLICDVEGLART